MAKKKRKSKTKKKSKNLNWRVLLFFLIIAGLGVFYVKDVEIEYYQNIQGLKGAELKTALHDRIREHKYLNFDQNISATYWWNNYFVKTDWHPQGYFWDMYSDQKHPKYAGGDFQAREHCMPRSWWGKRDNYSLYDANGDLHNLFPSDYQANSAKSNFPLGEVGISKFDNGVSKVGNNTYPNGYKGRVFEPSKEYKGDFARVYFYMVTCYEDYAYQWREGATKSMLKKGKYPAFEKWAIDMLLEWHRSDPVSEKEIKRNNEVYALQNNRNPFVDYPDLAEYIWGDKVNEPFDSSKNKPVIKQNRFSLLYQDIINTQKEFSYIYLTKSVLKWID